MKKRAEKSRVWTIVLITLLTLSALLIGYWIAKDIVSVISNKESAIMTLTNIFPLIVFILAIYYIVKEVKKLKKRKSKF